MRISTKRNIKKNQTEGVSNFKDRSFEITHQRKKKKKEWKRVKYTQGTYGIS